MKLTFIGADHEVTGSCHLVEACGKNILVDCGMEQGPDLYENQEIPVASGDIDYILLTHAHIDHSGRLTQCDPQRLILALWKCHISVFFFWEAALRHVRICLIIHAFLLKHLVSHQDQII